MLNNVSHMLLRNIMGLTLVIIDQVVQPDLVSPKTVGIMPCPVPPFLHLLRVLRCHQPHVEGERVDQVLRPPLLLHVVMDDISQLCTIRG